MFKLGNSALVLALALLSAGLLHAAPSFYCFESLNTSSAPNPSTQFFIDYIENMLTHKMITETHLQRLLIGLEQNKVINPITFEEAKHNNALYIHREGILNLIEDTELQPAALRRWLLLSHPSIVWR